MNKVLRISEAASLALHAAALLCANGDRRMSTREIAARIHASEAHLSKVLQRLTRAGFVRSVRGPGGGFTLDEGSEDIRLLDIYEAIEGPMVPVRCLLGTPICGGDHCILGGLVEKLNRETRDYLTRTRLSDLSKTFRSGNNEAKKDHQD